MLENNSFESLKIAPFLLSRLSELGFTKSTPIQAQAIPEGIEGKDIIGIAQTGTGKTLAYSIPIIQKLYQTQDKALILIPTRELAYQIRDVIVPLTRGLNIHHIVLIGGESVRPQSMALRKPYSIIIATPGRLLDHLEQRNLKLDWIKSLVFDEADRMLDMGFAPQIDEIMRLLPKQKQTLLFSATMPSEIMHIATNHMKLPVQIEIAPSGTASDHVTQEIFVVKSNNKELLLEKILPQYQGQILLFTRTKIGAKKLSLFLQKKGFMSTDIHSDKSQYQRKDSLNGFKNGKYKILVATDIAARGIDVKGIQLVINYDLPDDAESYVHRIGRTGRAGKNGHAISFATPEQGRNVKKIERLIKTSIVLATHSDIPAEKLDFYSPERSFRRKKPAPYKKFGEDRGSWKEKRGSDFKFGGKPGNPPSRFKRNP